MGQISTYQELIEAIEQDGIAATVKANRKPPLHTRILRELYELYPDRPEYIAFLAAYPLIPSDLADTIASAIPNDYTEIAQGLASNPRSSQITLSRLCDHPSAIVRLALAANPNLTPKEFQSLYEDGNVFVRSTLAINPSLPTPLQFLLSTDSEAAVKIALAGRKNLDADVALHLSGDDDSSVRAAVIHNWTHDPELLHCWAESNDARNQELLLKHPKGLEPGILQTLSLSPHGSVRRAAAKSTGLAETQMLSLAESDSPLDRIFLAGEPRIPTAIQRLLAQDSSTKVRRRLAVNTDIDPSIASHIAASEELVSCKALAQNPAITPECLSQLCTHSDDQVALIIAYREDLAPEHLELLLNARETHLVAKHLAFHEIGNDHLKQNTAEALATSAAPSHRNFASRCSELSGETLTQLAKDQYTQTRLCVARNEATPPHTLRALTHDSDREVLLAAEDNLSQAHRSPIATSIPSSTSPYENEAKERKPFLRKISKFFKD